MHHSTAAINAGVSQCTGSSKHLLFTAPNKIFSWYQEDAWTLVDLLQNSIQDLTTVITWFTHKLLIWLVTTWEDVDMKVCHGVCECDLGSDTVSTVCHCFTLVSLHLCPGHGGCRPELPTTAVLWSPLSHPSLSLGHNNWVGRQSNTGVYLSL